MADLIKRVARAIHAKRTSPDDGKYWFHEDASKCLLSRQLARAAINAMRDPIDDENWRAMVNAALAERRRAWKKKGPLRSPLNKERNGPAIGFDIAL
jgi:hypothetical protein